MWISLVVLVGILSAVSATDETCDSKACYTKDFMEWKIPKTEEDLGGICNDLLHYLNCVVNYHQKCAEKTSPFLVGVDEGQFVALLNVSKNFCNSSSALHRDVVENLDCLQTVLKSCEDNCANDFRSALDNLRNHTLGQNKSFEDCVASIMDMTCFLGYMSKQCDNPNMKTLYSEIFLNASMPKLYCDAENRKLLVEAIDVLELEGDLKTEFVDFVGKIQKN